jgi:VWFA-related protein
LVLFVAVLGGASPTAQQPGNPPKTPQPAQQEREAQQPPRFRVGANYVRVDVYPTRNGTPVQDLRKEDFEILEDNARQTVDAFEHVVLSPAGPQASRAEPASVRAGEQMAANSRARVFAFFLDPAHVWFEGAHAVKEPLIRLVDRILGPDDLVALMTPAMSAAQITFGRKTEVMAEMLRANWSFGGRTILPEDDQEREYQQCYPLEDGLVTEMILRRRERVALDALHDLVRYLGGVREERKAIVTITNGWRLYEPHQKLLAPTRGGVPGTPPVGVDDVGKLRLNPPRRDRAGGTGDLSVCERERMHLANMDNEDYFRRLIDLANRNNASFYPVDPRRLEVFEHPLAPDGTKQPTLAVDRAQLRQRLEVLHTLAEGTDGMAVVNTNDLERGLRRMTDDLSSYYLLGYYSSNPRLDGSYRRITVRVKKPGIDVRARRGYRAATADEVSTARTAISPPVPENARTAAAAIATLARIRPEASFAVHAISVSAPNGGVAALWIAGQLRTTAREFAGGATVAIEVTGAANGMSSTQLKPGERTFLIKVPVTGAQDTINVRARVTADGAATPVSDSVHVEPRDSSAQAMPFRRGPATANRLQPAPDFCLSRTERLHLELPILPDAALGTGGLLDRKGQALKVPVQVGERTDADGQRWLTADVALAALGAGDYLVEVAFISGGIERKALTAVRVTP